MKLIPKDEALYYQIFALFKTPPKKTILDWAKEERIISREESSSPGPWHSDGVPYLDEVMTAISDPRIEKIVMKFAAQMGKTNAGILNVLGYYITYDPCPIMIVQPTIRDAQSFSLMRINSMIRDTPCLRKKIDVEKTRSSKNKVLEKSFPGGYFVVSGANSASSLKSRPIRILLIDETDEMPEDLEGQGDPIELAIVRTNAFPDRKIIETSTSTIKGHSKIETAYDNSTREHWTHKCPKCGKWSQFIWTRLDFASLKMGCPYCEEFSTRKDWEKEGGKWIADNPGHNVRGFHVNALDSKQMTWETLISKWTEAQQLAKNGDFSKLKTFINTVLAEEWELKGEILDSHSLESRREVYEAELPDGVCVLTMGVDVQDNRLAYEVVGWGLGFENWGIEYGEIFGDPRLGEVWNRLSDLLSRAWSYKNGKRIRLSRIAIDTGGHRTTETYNYCLAKMSRGVIPIKGVTGDRAELIRPSKNKREKNLFLVGVDSIKYDWASWLKVAVPGDKYCHYPKDKDGIPVLGYDTTYFQMLTAEKRIVVRNKDGFSAYKWIVEAGVRNESFDCRVYARAALRILSSRDDLLLKKIHLSEPWAEQSEKKKAVSVTAETGKHIKKMSKNQRARAQGIDL